MIDWHTFHSVCLESSGVSPNGPVHFPVQCRIRDVPWSLCFSIIRISSPVVNGYRPPMPFQNRVLSNGDIIAHQGRGLFMGNRGILHDEKQNLGRARWRHKAWVTCVLKHKDWHREIMQTGHYTELFFLDEAVALAAGHRPCALCRRYAYNTYRDAVGINGNVKALDNQLHQDRAIPRTFQQRRIESDISQLPNGAVILSSEPQLVMDDALIPIAPDGYRAPATKPKSGKSLVATPALTLQALWAGYQPELHPTALARL